MAKIKLDLRDIFNKGQSIKNELNRVIKEVVDKRIPLIEIIPWKGVKGDGVKGDVLLGDTL